MTCIKQTWLGAYVLDALEPDETEEVGRHIAGCAECQDEIVSLAWIPGLLRAVRPEDIDALEAEPSGESAPDLGRLLAATRRRSRRRPVAVAIAGLAAAVAVALSVVTSGGGLPSDGSGRQTLAVHTVDARTQVRAAATLAGRAWGTELHLSLSWVKPGETCSLVARSSDGHTDVAATWVATYRGTASVAGATAIPLDQLRQLDVVTADGHRLARLVVPHPRPN